MLCLLVVHPNFLIGLILVLSLPRLWSLFRPKSDTERRYFEIAPARRLIMAGLYFGLIAFLLLGMVLTHVLPAAPGYQRSGDEVRLTIPGQAWADTQPVSHSADRHSQLHILPTFGAGG